jgi:hypothetical protein
MSIFVFITDFGSEGCENMQIPGEFDKLWSGVGVWS